MSGWADLDAELARWRAAGRVATFWWRDDDAVTETPALRRLLALRAALEVPLALAVIPARADAALAACVPEGVAVLQHGFAHRNHAPPPRAKAELGADRPTADVAAELADGWARLGALFGSRPLRVMVPPWNRIAPEIKAELPGLGYQGLSTFKPRGAKGALVEANTHVDIVDWGGARDFVGEGRAIGDAVAHLMLRRGGGCDGDEPTGLLTHHLAHDEGCWNFVRAFVAHTQASGAARWCGARDIFAR
jgi:hypothetical protein